MNEEKISDQEFERLESMYVRKLKVPKMEHGLTPSELDKFEIELLRRLKTDIITTKEAFILHDILIGDRIFAEEHGFVAIIVVEFLLKRTREKLFYEPYFDTKKIEPFSVKYFNIPNYTPSYAKKKLSKQEKILENNLVKKLFV